MINPYFIGLYLGDGCLQIDYIRKSGEPYYKLRVVCSDNLEYLKENVPIHRIEEHWSEYQKRNYYTIHIINQDYIKELANIAGTSKEKHFPILDKESTWEMISGFIDSDGYVAVDRVMIYNTNKILIDFIYDRLLEYDIGCNKNKISYKDNRKDCYYVAVNNRCIKRCEFNLRVSYKNQALNHLKEICSEGKKIFLDENKREELRDYLHKVMPSSTWSRRMRNKEFYLLEREINQYNITL